MHTKMRQSYRKQNTRALIKNSPAAYKPYTIILLFEELMVVVAHTLSRNGVGDNHLYDNHFCHVVGRDHLDVVHVGGRCGSHS